ncbi:hypothetical protein ILUMI_07603 [Ignelater luminosus]|uniref:Tyr recombinase domain-containing protein n=1 Tax=Ignelater luminosus TaxID=2038154 RepID=A0A8K0GBF9_IGNLU|nr:hypothetical protein ILUMI_07603 [Ignelater luminosus]
MESDSDESFSCAPEEIVKAAKYDLFMKWRAEKQVCSFTERVLLAYFEEKSKQWKSPTFWSTYSKLKSTLLINNNVDISKYSKLIAYLKNKSVGYKPRKSKTFSREEVYKFLEDAPDKHFLMHKVALIFGIAGALCREELYKMTLEGITDTGTVLIITIPDSKTHIHRRFTVIAETTQKNLNLIEIYRKYKAQRPKNVKSNHFFLQFRNGNCKTQVVGINTFSKIPSIVAKYLSLPNPDHYTGHAFRRSSASLLVDSGGDLIQLKKHGGWKSNAVAEGYVDESIQNKMDCANKIFTGGQSSRNTSNPASFIPSQNLPVYSHDCILSPTQMHWHLHREQRLQNRAKNKSVQKAVEHVEELPDLTAGGKCYDRYDTIEAARNLLNFKESSAVFSKTPVEIKKTYEDKGVQVNTYDDFTSYNIENLMDSDYKYRILTGVINLSNTGPKQVLSCPFCYQINNLIFFDSSY